MVALYFKLREKVEVLVSDTPVLVVDLDGTLIKSDMLFESFWASLSKSVGTAILALRYLLTGRAAFKKHLAAQCNIDVSALPYREQVLDLIRSWRKEGRQVALVTASDQLYALALAHHLGCFDEVYASDGKRNLKGDAKARFLVKKFGDRNFDYVGDSTADLAVWKHARRAITVGAPAALTRAVDKVALDTLHLEIDKVSWSVYIKAIRPHQWLKNLLIFLPALAAHSTSVDVWIAAAFAFIAFTLVASSVYVLNDLLDLAADRAHPRKRNRPFASGAIPLAHGSLMIPGILFSSLLIALAMNRIEFVGVLLAYFALTCAYSLNLKRRLIIDICTLAGLYTMRVIAGGVATGLMLSPWLLAFSVFIFLSLAAVKRQAELVDSLASGREQASGRAYLVEDLPVITMMGIASGYVSVLVMSLYIYSPAVSEFYSSPYLLWGICPILLYWISRIVMIAHRGHMHDDPIVFAIKDRISQFCGLLIAAILLAGSWV